MKTYVPGNATCSVGIKSEKGFGEYFFWVLSGIPKPGSNKDFEYYIIPSDVMAYNIKLKHKIWLDTPGKKGQPHKDNTVRTVYIPPRKNPYIDWDVSQYLNSWDLIEEKLKY